ncbi:hypothetical protein AFK64_04830 [Cronobacter sakazakii]|nr:hypothetical protein AFK64_04830 [Cronobacter sakazakii]
MKPRGIVTVNFSIRNLKIALQESGFKGKISLGKEVLYGWVYVLLLRKPPQKGFVGFSVATARCVASPTKSLMPMITGIRLGHS